jgi:hypothetical protein
MPRIPRPNPAALSRQELADALGVTYERAYYWTAREEDRTTRRARGVIEPTWTTRHGSRTYDWFGPDDLEHLEQLLAAQDHYRAQIDKRRGS